MKTFTSKLVILKNTRSMHSDDRKLHDTSGHWVIFRDVRTPGTRQAQSRPTQVLRRAHHPKTTPQVAVHRAFSLFWQTEQCGQSSTVILLFLGKF